MPSQGTKIQTYSITSKTRIKITSKQDFKRNSTRDTSKSAINHQTIPLSLHLKMILENVNNNVGELVGYPKETMGYSFYYPLENKVFVARNAKFLKNNLIAQEASGSIEDLEIIQEEDTHPSIDTSLNHKEDDQ
ncbi:hypothetical protein Tco_0575818 [Tanacetum coccineum]